jgi:hypothetical protein
MAAVAAPRDKANVGGGSVVQRHRRAWCGFHRPTPTI